LRRHNAAIPERETTRLQAGDVLVLSGKPAALAQAEERLLKQ